MKAALLSLLCFAFVAAPLRAQQPRPSPSPKAKATPSYSDEDLDRKAGRPPVAPGDKARTPQASTPPPEAGEAEVQRVNEAESAVPEDIPVQRVNEGGEGGGADGKGWAERAQALRDAVAEAERRVQELDSRAQELLWQYLQSTDTNEILSLKAEQQEILDQLPEARKAVDEARKALEDFEREAARAGVPPGELREKKKP